MDVQEAATHLGPMFEHVAADGQLALEHLHLPAGAAVLDVGTGAGNFAIFLATQGLDVVTGEPETDTTHYARKDWATKAAAVGVAERLRFQPFNASKMPFEDGRFAAVFFFGVLHHVDEHERRAVFSEALRVVKRGGRVVFFEPTRETLEQLWVHDPGHPLAADPSACKGDAKVEETQLKGRRMTIYLYRAV
jgi:SAM-dependent methyltransferase